MLPPSQTVFPAAFSISEIRVVVVVLPSDPVTARIVQGQTSKKTSISLVTSAPRLRRASMAGLHGCIPGVRNRTSASTPSRYPSPTRSLQPSFSSSRTSASSFSRVVLSQPVTSQPYSSSSRTRGRLLTPRPSTAIFLCFREEKYSSNLLCIIHSSFHNRYSVSKIVCLSEGAKRPWESASPKSPVNNQMIDKTQY